MLDSAAQSPSTAIVRRLWPSYLSTIDIVLLIIGCCCLTCACVYLSHGRLLWGDEFYSSKLVQDPSISHMVVAWRDGADGGGIVYYLLCRLWIQIVGFSELKLRLFSSLGIVVSFIVLWVAARRYFAVVPAAFSTAVIFFTSQCVVWQNFNGRYYGLFLAMTACVSYVFLYTAGKDRLSSSDLALVFVANAALVGTHILGIIYSLALLVAAIAFDRLSHRWRPRLYASVLASWFIFVISIPAIISSSAVARGGFWTVKPALRNLPDPIFAYSYYVPLCAKWLAVAAILLWLINGRPMLRGSLAKKLQSNPWIFLLAGLALAELVIFAKSRVGISIWSDRYLFPLNIASVFLLAALGSSVWNFCRRFVTGRIFLSVAALAAFFVFARSVLLRPYYGDVYPKAGTPDRLATLLPPNQEILTISTYYFLLMRTYDPRHHYRLLLDLDYINTPAHTTGVYIVDPMMDNWQHAGYLGPTDLANCDTLYSGPANATLLADPTHEQWVQSRLLNNPAFRMEQIATSKEANAATLWSVHRIGDPGPCR